MKLGWSKVAHGLDLGVTDPGKAPIHWVMAPPDMFPIDEYIDGPGDIEPPIPWCGEFSGCIEGLGLRKMVKFWTSWLCLVNTHMAADIEELIMLLVEKEL